MIICMLFVFFAIMELALVNYLSNWRKRRLAKIKSQQEAHKKYIDSLKSKIEEEKNERYYFFPDPNLFLPSPPP